MGTALGVLVSDVLLAQRRDIQAASTSMPSDEQRRALLDVDRQIRRAIQDVAYTTQELSRRSRGERRAVDIQVTTAALDEWLIEVRSVEGESGAEKVREPQARASAGSCSSVLVSTPSNSGKSRNMPAGSHSTQWTGAKTYIRITAANAAAL